MKKTYRLFILSTLLLVSNLAIGQTFYPDLNGSNAPTSPILTITFNDGDIVEFGTMQTIYIAKSDWSWYTQLSTGGSPVPPKDSRLTISGNILSIDLTGSILDNETEYLVYSTSGAIIVNGSPWNNLTVDTYWRFTTIPAIAPPTITSYFPEVNEQTADPNGDIVLTFNENIVQGTSGDLRIYVQGTISDPVTIVQYNSYRLSINANTLTIQGVALSANTDYYVTINSGYVLSEATGIAFEGISDVNTWTFSTLKEITWLGGSSNAWSNDANWSIPYEDGANIIISSNASFPATLNSGETATANQMTIEAGGKVVINNNANLNITNDLFLNSSPSSNADLVVLGTGNVAVNSNNTHINQYISDGNRLYYTATPINGVNVDNIGSGFILYYWDNATGDWKTTTAGTSLESGKGYVIDSEAAQTITYTGAINTADVTLTVNRGKSVGWNLVGNPYPCAIDWQYVTRSSLNVEDAFWIYDNMNNYYGAYNSTLGAGTNITSPIIPSNHAFWVKVAPESVTGSETISFDDACKIHINNSYLKSSSTQLYPKLKLAAINGVYKDEMIIAFGDGSVDPEEFKTTKYFSSSNNYIQPYVLNENTEYCIFSQLPLADAEITVPVSLRIPADGTYSIRRLEITSFEDNTEIYLEDLKDPQNPVITDLRNIASYSFTETAGENQDRFQIRFVPGTTTDIPDNHINKSNITVRSSDQSIIIENLETKSNIISIYTLTGDKITEESITSSTYSKGISTNGIYVIKIRDSEGKITTRKIFVK